MFQSAISDRPAHQVPRAGHALRRLAGAIASIGVLIGCAVLPASAQVPLPGLMQGAAAAPSVSDDTLALLAPIPHSTKNPLMKPSRSYQGMVVEDWIFYPTVLLGATFDDNLVWSSRKPVAAGGFRINPAVIAVRDAGMHKTTVYGEVDARIFPTLSNGDTVAGSAGIGHVWEIQRDFTFKVNADYARRSQHSGGLASLPGGGVGTVVSPLESNRFQGSVSLQKGFGKMFVGFSAETVKTDYDDIRVSRTKVSQDYRNSWTNNVSVRGGAWISPAIYLFAETVGNIREYSEASYISRGFRSVVGIGSDRISLFRGEVFAGIQKQFYDQPLLKAASSPVVGGKISWFPTRDLTVRASLDQSFSDSSLITPANPGGFPEKTTTAMLGAHYQIARDWAADLRVGYSHSAYMGSARRDTAWKSGIVIFHELTRNIGLTLDYEYARVISNADNASYSRNVIMLGIKYKY